MRSRPMTPMTSPLRTTGRCVRSALSISMRMSATVRPGGTALAPAVGCETGPVPTGLHCTCLRTAKPLESRTTVADRRRHPRHDRQWNDDLAPRQRRVRTLVRARLRADRSGAVDRALVAAPRPVLRRRGPSRLVALPVRGPHALSGRHRDRLLQDQRALGLPRDLLGARALHGRAARCGVGRGAAARSGGICRAGRARDSARQTRVASGNAVR